MLFPSKARKQVLTALATSLRTPDGAQVLAPHTSAFVALFRLAFIKVFPFFSSLNRFAQARASEESSCIPTASLAMAAAGELLVCGVEAVERDVAEALGVFSLGPLASEGAEATQTSQTIMYESGVSTIACTALKNSQTDSQRLVFLRLLRRLASHPGAAEQMIEAGCPLDLAHMLTEQGKVVFFATDLLWRLLEVRCGAATVLSDDPTALPQLTLAFCRSLTKASRSRDKQLRNELLILLTLVASFEPESHRHFIDFIPIVVDAVVGGERAPAYTQTGDTEDVELKGLLLLLFERLSSSPSVLAAMINVHLLQWLLSFLVDTTQPKNLGAFQHKQLQEQATALLVALASYKATRDELIQLDAPSTLLDASTHSTEALECLRLLACEARGVFMEKGAVGVLLSILANRSQSRPIRRGAALALAALCEQHPAAQREFGARGGVAVLVPYLRLGSSPVHEPSSGRDGLVSAALELAWSAVAGHAANEGEFLSLEGIDALMDLLEVAAPSLQHPTLGCLLDCMTGDAATASVRDWCSDKDATTTGAQLFLRLWSSQDIARGKSTSVITNIDEPLAGGASIDNMIPAALQASDSDDSDDGRPDTPPGEHNNSRFSESLKRRPLTAKDAPLTSRSLPATAFEKGDRQAALLAAASDIRAKLFCVLERLHFLRDNEAAWEKLTTEERSLIALTELYPRFRRGEVWGFVARALEEEGVRPITPDAELMSREVEELRALALQLREHQLSLVDDRQARDGDEERLQYSRLGTEIESAARSSRKMAVPAKKSARRAPQSVVRGQSSAQRARPRKAMDPDASDSSEDERIHPKTALAEGGRGVQLSGSWSVAEARGGASAPTGR